MNRISMTNPFDSTPPSVFDGYVPNKKLSKARTAADVVRAGDEEEDCGNGRLVDGEFVKATGIGWLVTAFMLVGEMVGAGVVALPIAVQQCGFLNGVVLCCVMAVVATFSSIFLGLSWATLPRRWPEYRLHCRKPYAQIGFRALGPKAGTAVSCCLNVTQFGICVVLLLLASRNFHDLLYTVWPGVPGVCTVIAVTSLLFLPITFLKSPEDFWGAIVIGMLSAVAAVGLLVLGTWWDFAVCREVRREPDFTWFNLFLAFGPIVFTFGGHSAFPTVQHDMQKPSEFTRSSIVAFLLISALNAPVVLMAYSTYGDSMRDSLIPSIQTPWIQQATNLMIALHCMLTLIMMINPLSQEAEEFLSVPHEFGAKRVLLRTGMLCAVTVVAESVPNFGPVLNLMGASTITLTSLVLPSVFYLFIRANEKKSKLTGRDEFVGTKEMMQFTDRKVLVICGFIVAVGVIGGVAATVSALRDITGAQFQVPCYLKSFYPPDKQTEVPVIASTNCCGAFQNVTVRPATDCNPPNLDYYGIRNIKNVQ